MAVGSPARRQTALSIVVICLVLVATLAPATAETAAAQQAQPDADNTVTRIEVFENGSATWTIRIRTRLDTDQRVDEYTAFQSRFRTDTAQYLDPFRSRMQGVVANAENTTGRQMRATNFTATTSIQEVPRRWGVVTYRFTWTNFAAQENGRVIVGDIFQGGFFIAADDSLQLVAPDGYGVARVDPAPDSSEADIVTWTGREDFADARPRVVFAPVTGQSDGRAGTATETSPTGTGGDGALQDGQGVGIPGAVAASVLLFVLLVGLGGVVLFRRRSHETAAVTGTATAARDPPNAPPATAHTGVSGGDDPSETVLTDEERVRTLLDSHGGRMRQAAIAEEFDWSASKTSRVVGRMAEDGSVEKLQLGRENLVTLAEDA